jgi:DNA-binding response OmpR family regulator
MKSVERKTPLAVVIEDEPNLSQIYSSAVEAAGYAAKAFLDGEQGLNALKELEPAIVVLDLHLPGVGGNKILEYIRSDKRLENTKVILITADTGMANMLDPDTDLTLLKPVSFHQLRDMAIRLRNQS